MTVTKRKNGSVGRTGRLAVAIGLVGAAATALLGRQSAQASGLRAQPPSAIESAPASGEQSTASTQKSTVTLQPTNHPRLPADLSRLWLAPDQGHARSAAMNEFLAGVKLEVETNFAKALPIFRQPLLRYGPLTDYAVYYAGLAELRLGRPADAKRTFEGLEAREPVGYLSEAAAFRVAECSEAMGDHAAAAAVYERLSNTRTSAPDDILMRLGKAARAAGDTDKAAKAFARVYYEFPLSDLAALASSELDTLPNVQPLAFGNPRYKLELGRAERLFASKRYAQARAGFETLGSRTEGDDRELVHLRLAECDYYLKRPRNARDEVRPYVGHASRRAEALFFYALAERELGDHADYLKSIRKLIDDYPSESWAQEALNNLATHYILQSDDDNADATLRELYARFPTGSHAERAAWKIGWRAFRTGRHGETIRVFERAAADFPRSDYRPSWLYWSGRAHDALGERPLAQARYALVATDYLNSYYGRLAVKHLNGPVPPRRLGHDEQVVPDVQSRDEQGPEVPSLPRNQAVIRALLGLELYDQALDELRYAQKIWGDSPPMQATLGWVYHQRGDLRAGINAMKRAYPQYLAAGGEKLPAELLKVLFPVEYWPLIRRHAAEHHLDPYMLAALIAQESTFTADVRSYANAYGLMQILPSTGRYYARTLHLKRFSISMLTTPETNLRMGTAYFADLVKQFGGTDYALASYNAGESRVARWIAERPHVDRDEFIDDIPFPQTQNYVKKIIGTAEDYRRLYGPAQTRAGVDELEVEGTRAAAAASTGQASANSPAAAHSSSNHTAARRSTARRSTARQSPQKRSSAKRRALAQAAHKSA